MTTSNFAKSGTDPRAVSIALYPPKWLPNIRTYITLAPTKQILEKWKADPSHENYTIADYTAEYQTDVLDKLDPIKVLQDLGDDAILCCYESAGQFCHRHLVSNWLRMTLGVCRSSEV